MADIWRYRRWVWRSAVSDLHNRYAGSGLGVFWNIISPLVMLCVYVFIFTQLLVQGGNSNRLFALYVTCGFLPWVTFADGLNRSTQSFLTNSVYLKKLAVPEIVFVAQTALSTFFSMCIAVTLLICLAVVLGQGPSPSWLLIPVVVVLWQGLGFGLGMLLATINVFFRDVTQIVSVLIQIWMWSVPVIYLEDMLPAGYRWTLPFNPAYPFVVGLRAAVMDTPAPFWIGGAMLGWTLLASIIGAIVLVGLRSELRDVL